MKQLKYLSTFSGVGGFELGIQQAYVNLSKTKGLQQGGLSQDSSNVEQSSLATEQPTCVGYSEINKYACQIYDKHFKHKNYGDICSIKWEEVPDIDLVVGGFPCQSFSIAGKRKGFEDTRGTLFFEIAKGLKIKQPNFVLLENVKGLISHDKGKTLEVILETLQELGYYVNIEVYNSKDFSVPQNRERIFILCRHIKTLINDGVEQSLNLSSPIISEFLFQILLNNLAEVIKLQETKSKDWVIGYLLLKEIYQNLKSKEENIKDGISILMEESKSLSTEEVWQNIDTWLQKNLAENFVELNKYTTSTAIRQIIESKTYTYSTMLQSILAVIVQSRNLSKDSWKKTLLNLTLIREYTKKYARINDKKEEVIITETGNAYIISNLQDFEKYFVTGHLRGTPRPEVFPIGQDDQICSKWGETGNQTTEENMQNIESGRRRAKCNNIKVFGNLNNNGWEKRNESIRRVYDSDGISPTVPTCGGGGVQPKIISKKGKEKRNQDLAATLTAGGHGGGNHSDMDLLVSGSSIRRLTPIEFERLQGFPEIETCGIIKICLDSQNNYVNVENQCRKSLKPVGSVEKKDSQEDVKYAVKFLNIKNQQTNKHVHLDVLINCEENGVEIHSQGKLLLNAKNAEKKNWSHQLIKIEDFVQMLVGINTIVEKITNGGGVELHQNEQCLAHQKNGKKLVSQFGKEIMQPVEYVKKDLIILKKLLKSITSNHLDTGNLEQKLTTLYSFVIPAIIGYIPEKIQNQDSFTIIIKTKVGWTYGISDTQRYKVMGNAVTTNVVQAIMEKLLK